MRHCRFIVPALLLAAAPLRAQDGRHPHDTLRLLPQPARSDTADVLRLGLASLPLPFTVSFDPPPAADALPPGPRFAPWAARWADTLRARLARQRREYWLALRPGAPRAARAPGRLAVDAGPPEVVLPDVIAEFADLGLRVFGRAELGGAWTRYEPCDPVLQLNCNPTLFPLLKPDIQFGVQVAGTVSDRIHIDVDYDQRREFDATNNINVYYQGLEGEVLQRVELGDVSIRLPPSRYLTRGVPGGNFGFKATGGIGPLDFQAVWAQQKGDVATREFRLGGTGATQGLVQDARVVLDDADYAQAQFFFLVDPAQLAGAPHIDVLGLAAEDAPAALRPARGGVIQVFRDERPSLVNPQQQAQLGYFLAEAVGPDGVLRHSGRFRRLVPGEDYLVHASGLWLMLRSPLRPDEALAVAYTTEAGAVVGTLDPELAPAGTTPTLRLVRGPETIHQPGRSTWDYEMHQVYRLDGSSGVDPASIELDISLGEAAAGVTYREAFGRSISFLKLFGLDEEAPEEALDEARVFQPGGAEFGGLPGDPRFGGTYVVFPTLRPFAEPPPVPSASLSAADAQAVLGADANLAIYDEPDPVIRSSSTRFRLNFSYRVRVEGLVSSFNLGAFGIREGSERVTVDGRVLERGVDYAIDYELGQVTLMHPEQVFGANPNAEIRATWEQQAAFRITPRSLFGLSTTLHLGTHGELNLVGLYQAERSIVSRPQLGLEPSSILLGGASGDIAFGADWLDRAVAALPGAPEGADAKAAPSRIHVAGELATSMPNPNREGATFLDDFEASDAFSVGLDRTLWRLGSRPGDPVGATDVLPVPLDASTATTLVWQDDLLDPGGRVAGPLLPRQIDQQINVAGAQRTEPVLYLSFGDGGTPPGTRRWRAVTTVLGTTGRDMSRSEYLEFYAAADPGQELALIFDIGVVSEDAFYFDGNGLTTGQYPNGRPWGEGILDEEARIAEHEIWGPALDSLGLWNRACRAAPAQQSYPLGDPRANCARGNGRVDTEDLDGNGVLDGTDGAYFRYVVRLDAASPYRVRGPEATGTQFSLYRIPLRGAGGVAVGGATEAAWRFVKHLRLTVAGLPEGGGGADVTLARMRIIGSRWTKRDVHGILAGAFGDAAGAGAGITGFRVGPVSRITDGAAYAPPPGVRDQLQDPTRAFGGTTVEYNEKSLRLAYDGLEPGDRAEAYYRFPQRPRNLLDYRQLRFWALPRAGNWGAPDGERLILSIGTDARNRYIYTTTLHAATGGGPVGAEAWLPEVVVDFERWFALRAQAEQLLIAGDQAPGTPVVVWSEDSAYAVVLEDRARAPNLAAVREIGFSVYNAGATAATGEVWIDELRLGGAATDAGLAGHIELGIAAGDFLDARVSYSNRGARFRQAESEPGYLATSDLGVDATLQLGRLVPAGWGVDAPLSVTYTRAGVDPTFLDRSDVRADRLPGLRESGAVQRRIGLALRKSTPTGNPWAGLLLDGASLNFEYRSGATRAITTRNENTGFQGGIGYFRLPDARELDITPGAVESVLRALAPAALEHSGFFRDLLDARLRWTPDVVSFNATYDREERRSFRYAGILASGADAAVAPIAAPREGLETRARIGFRPFPSLTAGLSFASTRDLLPADRAAATPGAREAIERARDRVAGIDVGWETRRTLRSDFEFRPRILSWLRPGLGYTATFHGDRNASYWETRVTHGDTTAVLERTLRADRELTRSLVIEPAALVRAAAGPESAEPGAVRSALYTVGRAVETIDLNWTDALGSHFERRAVDPGAGFQLGLGDFDRFRIIDGDTAATVIARDAFRARTSLRLPFGTGFEAAYAEGESEVLALLGGRRAVVERAWPDLRLAWVDLPLPRPLRAAIAHGSASIGYRAEADRSIFGGIDGQERASDETAIPLQLTVGLANGISASYTGLFSRESGTDPTGTTEGSGQQHAIQLGGSFRAPDALRESIPGIINASLRYGFQAREACRRRGGTPEPAPCIPFVDLLDRQLSLTLETIISQLNVGFQMSYNDRRSAIGIRSGSSQFQLGLFGEFDFSAGTLPGGAR
ncbi:MAG TPA: hypothetical protein VF188_08170 [Longimicrobiales bacterium]